MKAISWFILCILILSFTWPSAAQASEAGAQQERPFGLPFADPPGPDTWLLTGDYGNTVGAYRQRRAFYGAGQGIHFGIDFSARCGYPVTAVADGVVAKVDAFEHGSAPHNLMIDHENGYASFYGHLFERPNLTPGQRVSRGEVVAKVGDPDVTCTSRPHLHLEIRNAGVYNEAYNPVLLIDADWETLALSGASPNAFARDLSDPRRWQYVEDQPSIRFGSPLLNDYANPWPPDWSR